MTAPHSITIAPHNTMTSPHSITAPHRITTASHSITQHHPFRYKKFLDELTPKDWLESTSLYYMDAIRMLHGCSEIWMLCVYVYLTQSITKHHTALTHVPLFRHEQTQVKQEAGETQSSETGAHMLSSLSSLLSPLSFLLCPLSSSPPSTLCTLPSCCLLALLSPLSLLSLLTLPQTNHELNLEDMSEEEDAADMYFKKPEQLLDIFAQLEERNLFLIQVTLL
jgi:hypothetical protein